MKKIKIAGIFVAVLFSIGANAQKKVTQRVTATTAEQTTQQGRDVRIEGMGITKTVAMNGGALHIEGADNHVTVNGFADRVTIEGANVTVRIDRVNSVKIEGTDTKVFYKTSNNKSGKPAVSVFGSNSSVVKVK